MSSESSALLCLTSWARLEALASLSAPPSRARPCAVWGWGAPRESAVLAGRDLD